MSEIVRTDGVLGGQPRLDGHRISVFQIGELYLEGEQSPEDIADQLGVSLADVHAALSSYYDNPDEMSAIRERRQNTLERLEEESKAPETLSP